MQHRKKFKNFKPTYALRWQALGWYFEHAVYVTVKVLLL